MKGEAKRSLVSSQSTTYDEYGPKSHRGFHKVKRPINQRHRSIPVQSETHPANHPGSPSNGRNSLAMD